jgi:hypothetical protein
MQSSFYSLFASCWGLLAVVFAFILDRPDLDVGVALGVGIICGLNAIAHKETR